MALFNLFVSLIPFFSAFPIDVSGRMLYLIHRGETEKAFASYLQFSSETNTHDFHLLQQAAKELLEHGIDSKDPEIRLLCMFGAGVASSCDLLQYSQKAPKAVI